MVEVGRTGCRRPSVRSLSFSLRYLLILASFQGFMLVFFCLFTVEAALLCFGKLFQAKAGSQTRGLRAPLSPLDVFRHSLL